LFDLRNAQVGHERKIVADDRPDVEIVEIFIAVQQRAARTQAHAHAEFATGVRQVGIDAGGLPRGCWPPVLIFI
jgi:hypothetical protein